MSRLDLGRVAVIGVGLIGGSFALALKAAKACGEVVGVGRDPRNMRTALELGVIDRIAKDPAEAASDAQLIVIATPMAQFEATFAAIASPLARNAIITDVGSTKRDAIRAARKALGAKISQYVPAHPIAGAERSGAAAANANLFRDRRVVLTPLAENSASDVDIVTAAWQSCGARVARMQPEAHDAVLGAVSHFPHVLAYALVHEFAMRDNAAELFGFAGGGFKDFTRIASSHPEMWRDICVVNREAIVAELDRYAAKLDSVRSLLAAGDGPALERLFAEAKSARDQWIGAKRTDAA
jgi:prephenate dehydrogenase